jgi:hypothetical protein
VEGTSGAAVNLELNIGLGFEVGVHSPIPWISAIVAPMGVGFGLAMPLDMETGAEGNVGLGIDFEYSTGSSINVGSTVKIYASQEFTTSEEGCGALYDVLVTPDLAIRTVTVKPIIFRNDVEIDGTIYCDGAELDDKSVWSMLDGKDLKKSLRAYHDNAEPAVQAATIKKALAEKDYGTLKNLAVAALQDKSWNAVGMHTVGEVLYQRIPQLRERCREEWYRLQCCYGLTSINPFGTALLYLSPSPPSKQETWCKMNDFEVSECYCSDEEVAVKSDDNQLLAEYKLFALLDGIKGWINALNLNEQLKSVALTDYKISPTKLLGEVPSRQGETEEELMDLLNIEDVLEEGNSLEEAESVDTPKTDKKVGEEKNQRKKVDSPKPDEFFDKTLEKERSEDYNLRFGGKLDGMADANIIAFSGADGSITYTEGNERLVLDLVEK